MTGDWQDLVALALVGAALAYLVRLVVRQTLRRSGGGCATGGCGSCPVASKAPGRAREVKTNGMPALPIVTFTKPR
jgi:hypothetical protein